MDNKKLKKKKNEKYLISTPVTILYLDLKNIKKLFLCYSLKSLVKIKFLLQKN